MSVRIIAIDGPAASGKSSTAAAVANALGLPHVDSGALYRAVTWRALVAGTIDPTAIVAAADAAHLTLAMDDPTDMHVRMGDRPIESAIRSDLVTANVSAISAVPQVRDWVNQRLRAAIAQSGGVMDGRDIGTVVFPDASLKVFLTATPEARARRRLLQAGESVDPEELAREVARLKERDRLDSSRAVAPLSQAADARVLDTTNLSFEEQVERILGWEKGSHGDTEPRRRRGI